MASAKTAFILLLGLLLLLSPLATGQCGNNEFECDGGNCIDRNDRCDGRDNDCGTLDNSDEEGCNSVTLEVSGIAGIVVAVFVVFVCCPGICICVICCVVLANRRSRARTVVTTAPTHAPTTAVIATTTGTTHTTDYPKQDLPTSYTSAYPVQPQPVQPPQYAYPLQEVPYPPQQKPTYLPSEATYPSGSEA